MIVAFKYSLLNNIPEFLIFALIMIQQLTPVPLHIMLILLLITGLLWGVYSIIFKRWFNQHPEYNPANRQLTKLGYVILALA
ncbi:hypothetical protein [Lentilactobacillus rapi]|uniref:hypothetical protein n=1 Tax=Lentilactobacillus rapi TaxID=481723 RepID=UPI0006D0CB69|nr:hypothetical protein [Lentilactobacillus rapi]